MTTRLLALTWCIITLVPGSGVPSAVRYAQEPDAAGLVSRLREKYDDIDNLSLSFRQTTVFAVSRAEQETAGRLIVGKGNRYRVTLEDRVIVSDGKSVWSWSKANAQVIVDRFRDDPAGLTPERLLTRIPEEYRAVATGSETVDGRETDVLKLTPGSPARQMKWLKLWVDEDDLTVRKMQVRDLGDNDVTYLLSDIGIDRDLPDSVFIFTAPPGADILDLR